MTIVIDIRPLMGGKHSGVEIYIHNLLEHLCRLDQKNTYVLFANASSDQSKYLPRYQQKNVYTVQTRIPNKLLNLSLFLFKRPRLDQLLKNFKPDIWFLPDLRPTALSRGIKKVSVVHDLSFHHYPRFFSSKTRLWHKLLRPRQELSKSHKIIAVSDFTKKDLIATYHLPASKITVIHQGVAENFGKNLNEAQLQKVKNKYHLPDRYFLFLATLEPRKNTQRLINTFKKYKIKHHDNLKLVMAGIKNNRIFSALNLEKNPDLHFTGFIHEEDKAAVFSMAEAFLYPSLFEGFGLPLPEAMKCGTPIITSNVSSMPEIVKKAALLVNPEREDELLAAFENIQKATTIEHLKSKMAAQIKNFSWEKCAISTLALLTSP